MLARLALRFLTSTSPRLLWKFVYNFGFQGIMAVRRFHQRIGRGGQFPPFVFLSITNRCNLRCQGCWVTTTPPYSHIDIETIDRIISQSARQGTRFFGIMGGEPLLHADLSSIFEHHRNCYFQLFTNGTLLTRQVTQRLAKAGNVTPLVSIEGDEVVSDLRRGGQNVLRRGLAGLENCLRSGLITGVATSVCRSNIDQLVREEFLDRLIAMGVHYVWYYSFRPSGANPCPELALDADALVRLREFIVEMRCRKPIVIVDTYYDGAGTALCPAIEGMSCHINPWGDVEPCPPIQFARENIHDSDDFVDLIERSNFLRAFRDFAGERTKGCILLEDPAALRQFMLEQNAKDSTGRHSGFEELAAMSPLPSQHLPGREIPEKHWAYRFAKKHWFFGFGGYG